MKKNFWVKEGQENCLIMEYWKIFKWELLKESLISDIEGRDMFMNGISQSYEYENMGKYDVKELEELDWN